MCNKDHEGENIKNDIKGGWGSDMYFGERIIVTLYGTPSTCLAPGCGKNVDILDQADALGIVSNLPLLGLQGKPSQSSGISPLSKSMGEIFTLSSPPIRMGDEGTTTQQQLIEELLTDIPVVGGISEESSCATDARELKPTYGKEGARALVKNEIFNTIGKEKIARVKSTPPGFVLNLTVDESDYIIAEVLKGASSKGTA
ncbi:hypothetical protein GLOIN_2v1478122 [Rhizophagus irregularis DAOM 181602=DAOM 197198]|nr:hypothetical protein GLOIN_2v1478122 [Rhizophagus irregularis DAOM 181602=DAOM 197198]